MAVSDEAGEGASSNEQLLLAAKQDSEDLFNEVIEKGGFDVNFQDGIGNTALHYAVSTPSPTVMELLLEHEGTDVDLQNRLEGKTPLHLAISLQPEEVRTGVVESLLEAGADPRIKDRKGSRPIDLLPVDDPLRESLRRAEAEIAIDDADIADDDDVDDGEEGEGSDDD